MKWYANHGGGHQPTVTENKQITRANSFGGGKASAISQSCHQDPSSLSEELTTVQFVAILAVESCRRSPRSRSRQSRSPRSLGGVICKPWSRLTVDFLDRFQRQSAPVLNPKDDFFLHLVRSWLRIKVAQICPWLQLLDCYFMLLLSAQDTTTLMLREWDIRKTSQCLWACGTIFGSMNIHFPAFWSIHMRSEELTAFFPKLLWLLLQESHHLFSRLVLPESPFKNRGICHCNTSQCGL